MKSSLTMHIGIEADGFLQCTRVKRFALTRVSRETGPVDLMLAKKGPNANLREHFVALVPGNVMNGSFSFNGHDR